MLTSQWLWALLVGAVIWLAEVVLSVDIDLPPPEEPPPIEEPISQDTPVLKLQFVPSKGLVFHWASFADTTFYQIYENVDGASGYHQISNNLPTETRAFTVVKPLYQILNARYILSACYVEDDCVDSEVVLVDEQINQAIGSIQPTHTPEDRRFGAVLSLSADGSVLAVSAPAQEDEGYLDYDFGAVYVYQRDGLNWVQQAHLSGNSGQEENNFGSALSLSADGKTLAVGANYEDRVEGNVEDAGAAYVFQSVDNQWQLKAKLQSNHPDVDFAFGETLSLSGDGHTLAVRGTKATYLFEHTAGQWQQTALIDDSSRGISMNFDGDVIALGIHEDRVSIVDYGFGEQEITSLNTGAVAIYQPQTEGWSKTAHIQAPHAQANYGFGYVLSLDDAGVTLAVGANPETNVVVGEEDPMFEDDGSASVFQFVDGQWQNTAYFTQNSYGYLGFGLALSLSGDGKTLAVGARYGTGEGAGLYGAPLYETYDSFGGVYLYQWTQEQWQMQNYIQAPVKNEWGFFGRGVSLSGDGETLAVGAGRNTPEWSHGLGVVYLY